MPSARPSRSVDEVLAMAGVRRERGRSPRRVDGEIGRVAARARAACSSSSTTTAGTRRSSPTSSPRSPPELKPNLGPIANPVNFFTENHFTAIGIAPAVGHRAGHAAVPGRRHPAHRRAGHRPRHDRSRAPSSLGDPGFATPDARAPAGDGGGRPRSPASEASAALAGALPALLVVVALLLSPLFGLGQHEAGRQRARPRVHLLPHRATRQEPPPARLT